MVLLVTNRRDVSLVSYPYRRPRLSLAPGALREISEKVEKMSRW